MKLRTISEDFSEIAPLFGDNAKIMSQIIVGSGLDKIPVKLINPTQPVGGMYGIKRIFISRQLATSNIPLFVILHEYGHAARDVSHGPIYNYWLKKDTDGNDLSTEQTLAYIANEEDEASAWATRKLAPYPLIRVPSLRRSSPSHFRQFLQYIDQSGAKTVQEVEQAFLQMIT